MRPNYRELIEAIGREAAEDAIYRLACNGDLPESPSTQYSLEEWRTLIHDRNGLPIFLSMFLPALGRHLYSVEAGVGDAAARK